MSSGPNKQTRHRQNSLVWRKLAKAFHSTLLDHCANTGDTMADIAEDIGCAASHLSNMATERVPIPLDVAVSLVRLLGDDSLITEICRLCGGTFLRLADADQRPDVPVLDLVREYTEAATTVAEALRDGKITRDEWEECETQLDEAISTAVALKSFLHEKLNEGTWRSSATLRDAEGM